MRAAERQGGADEPQASDVLERLAAAPTEERRTLLFVAVRSIVADILGMDAATSLNPEKRLEELGVDSLLSMAVARALQTSLRIALPRNAITMYPTLDRLVDYILPELDGAPSTSDARTER